MKRELVQCSLKLKKNLYSSPNATLLEILKKWIDTWEGCCHHCEEILLHLWHLVFHLTWHKILISCFMWHFTLPISICFTVCPAMSHRECSHSSKQAASFANSRATLIKRYRPLSRHISNRIPSEVHCGLECLYNLSDSSETDRVDFMIFHTWYPPEQNTTAFHYKPDEKSQIPTTTSTSSAQMFSSGLSESILAGVNANFYSLYILGQGREHKFLLIKSALTHCWEICPLCGSKRE